MQHLVICLKFKMVKAIRKGIVTNETGLKDIFCIQGQVFITFGKICFYKCCAKILLLQKVTMVYVLLSEHIECVG